MARREVAQQHRHLPVLHQLVGETGVAARDLLRDQGEGLRSRSWDRARCRRTPPARRACGCRSARRLRGSLRGSRFSGVMSHSRCQFVRMKGVMTSSTKARQDSRMRRCSSERPRAAEMSSMTFPPASMMRSGLPTLPISTFRADVPLGSCGNQVCLPLALGPHPGGGPKQTTASNSAARRTGAD